jgi:hypothetical protein
VKTLLVLTTILAGAGSLMVIGCGDLPPLPGPPSQDGAFLDTVVDSGAGSSDGVSESSAVDGSGTPVVDAGVDASSSGIDASGKPLVDASGTGFVDSGKPLIDASAIDASIALVCPTGYANCNGNDSDGCETAITTPEHCGACKTACGPVANGTATCVNSKCAAKCTAPYQDCDGKYDNGCEIPVGRANACDGNGLATFSGSKPPCGTPYCGGATASDAVVSFGSWYCSFCIHCYVFDNGGSYCLYGSNASSTTNGEFSGERCSTCCAAGGSQSCPLQ